MKIIKVVSTNEGFFSKKYLIETDKDKVNIEVVFIDFIKDKIICMSAQAGCARGCLHCATTFSPNPFIRNLSTEEICEMTKLVIKDAINGNKIDVLDFSGIGDCSSNWNAVRDSCVKLFEENWIKSYSFTSVAPSNWCETLFNEMKLGLVSPKKITISLHGADVDTRRQIIPFAEDPLEALKWWSQLKKVGCRIVLNYVVHSNNTTSEHKIMLAKFIKSNKKWIDTVRISPFNSVVLSKISSGMSAAQFAKELKCYFLDEEVQIVCFYPVGTNENMACGQMRASFQ